MSGGDVFSLGAGQRDGGLFFAAPADRSACKLEDKTRCGLTIVNIAGPVGVDKTVQRGTIRCATLEYKVTIGGGADVPERSIESALVVRARSGGVSPKGGHRVCEVGAAPQHGVHQCAEGALISFSIDLCYGEFYQMLVW